MTQNDLNKIRDAIVTASLEHAAFDGWTLKTLEQGAVDAGYEAGMVRAVFVSPVKDALTHYSAMADAAMLARLAAIQTEGMRIRDKIATAVMLRFEYLDAHKEAFRRSAQYWVLPSRKIRAAKIIWASADAIWHWAGDTSTDYNRYTKRSLLSAILFSTTLVFLGDETDDLQKTKSFLDRRIENVMQFNKGIHKFKKAS